MYRHTVNDHNAKQHLPIRFKYAWAAKHWHHRLFSFLLAIIEVYVNLAEAYFTPHKEPRSQLEFQRMLAMDLINNEYFLQEKML